MIRSDCPLIATTDLYDLRVYKNSSSSEHAEELLQWIPKKVRVFPFESIHLVAVKGRRDQRFNPVRGTRATEFPISRRRESGVTEK